MRFSLALVCFALGFCLWAEAKPESSSASPRELNMTLIFFEGDVLINGKSAEEGQTIPRGGIIETAEQGYAEILFADKNIIRIMENSLTTLNVGPGSGVVDLERGAAAFILEKLSVLGLGGKDFTVTTPVTTAGIRGTAFYLKIEDPRSVYFCNCHGIIDIAGRNGDSPLHLEALEHKAVLYREESSLITAAEGTLLYHSNDEMDSLAAKIQHIIPWGRLE